MTLKNTTKQPSFLVLNETKTGSDAHLFVRVVKHLTDAKHCWTNRNQVKY